MENRIRLYLEEYLNRAEMQGTCLGELEKVCYLIGKFHEIGFLDEEEVSEWTKKIAFLPTQQIESMELSARAFNSLKRNHIRTCCELRKLICSGELIEIRSIGKTTATEIIRQALKNHIVEEQELPDFSGPFYWEWETMELKEKRTMNIFKELSASENA